jgi:hypothetical protein
MVTAPCVILEDERKWRKEVRGVESFHGIN